MFVTEMIKLVFVALFLVCQSSAINFCGNHQFECTSGQCIDESRVCDYRLDCDDWSDESACGWCKFNTSHTCGWTADVDYSCYGSECSLAQWIDSTGQKSFTLVGPSLESLSKSCVIEVEVYMANLDYPKCYLSINVQGDNSSRHVASYPFSKYSPGVCKDYGCTRRLRSNLGYVPKGSPIKIIGQAVKTTSNQDTLVFGVKSIMLIGCSPKGISLDCNFKSYGYCNWEKGTRFRGSWKWSIDGYIYNSESSLSEIRSPVIVSQTRNDSHCLSFDYFNNSTENAVHVTKINLETDGSEEVLWSSKNYTETWSSVNIDFSTNIDFDIGMISVANTGIVAIDNLSVQSGTCGLPMKA